MRGVWCCDVCVYKVYIVAITEIHINSFYSIIFTYILHVKNEAPIVGLTCLLNKFPTYRTTKLVFPTPIEIEKYM